jgi:transitional endoplasmic reticulum ATPase
LPIPVMHNQIIPQNIMLDLASNIPKPSLIDFGFATSLNQTAKPFSREGLDMYFVASECFHNTYSPQSDLFSVGAIMYHILFGTPPWFKTFSKFKSIQSTVEDNILEERRNKLIFPEVSNYMVDFDESIINIIKKSLQHNPKDRFQSANEFMQAINGTIVVKDMDSVEKIKLDTTLNMNQKEKAKGFDAIAGMNDLKEQLKLDVIDALHNPEEYEKYGITIPNGMLLYGPPGCGKTFFAKHFAEEVGFNFVLATPATLKSKYVNATQENIARMFEDAEKNAPTIIFIDEINELLPSRDSDAHEMSKSAVNEMLAQMDRTGEKGIFIIGATNYPELIDPAMLRAGRLDKKFYLPPPDFEARKVMFEMYLKNRPLDVEIDYQKLSTLTENYVSSDIEFLVNESSRFALREKSKITMQILEAIIKSTKPSVPLHELQKYETTRAKIDLEK